MQEPLKVTLPPFRRGDGKPFGKAGRYAIRCADREWMGEFTAWLSGSESMHTGYDYAGPIEFIETSPEPEPLTLEGCRVVVEKTSIGNIWTVRQVMESYGCQCSRTTNIAPTRAAAIEANNAAVRAMEGKP